MALFHWSEKYSVHISTIDEQHKKLFDLINDLHEAIVNEADVSIARKVVVELVNYTLQHFIYEENLLEEHGYPDLEDQRREHDDLTDKVMHYKKGLEAGTDIDLTELMSFMLEWLQEHILRSDMKYSPYLKERGVN